MSPLKRLEILVLHGPNLNMLGVRQPEIYGRITLKEINEEILRWAEAHGTGVEIVQSNSEGDLVEAIQRAAKTCDAIVINPAAYTHTSVAILDALLAVGIPSVEVHMTNIYGREDFRRTSITAAATRGQICGFGAHSYILGLEAVWHILTVPQKTDS